MALSPRFFERPALPGCIASVNAELTAGNRLGNVVRDEYHLECSTGTKFGQSCLNVLRCLWTCHENDVVPQLDQAFGGVPAVQSLARAMRIAAYAEIRLLARSCGFAVVGACRR